MPPPYIRPKVLRTGPPYPPIYSGREEEELNIELPPAPGSASSSGVAESIATSCPQIS